MTITFTTKFRHILGFNCVHQLQSIPLQVVCVGLAAFVAWSSSRGIHCEEKGICLGVGIVGFILTYVAVLAFQFVFNVFYLYARDNRSVLTEHRVELTSEGLYEETAYNRSLYFWHGIHKIVAVAGFVAVYVTSHSALLVPNSTFASAEQRRQFIEAIKARRPEVS